MLKALSNSKRFSIIIVKYLSIILILLVIVISFVRCFDNNIHIFTRTNAVNLIDSYVSAVENGDSITVYQLWSKESRDREGFWSYWPLKVGGSLSFAKASYFFRYYTFEIKVIKYEEDYYIINLNWILKDSLEYTYIEDIPMKYYVINEDNRWLLIHPFHLLTREWKTYESKYFIYHYSPNIGIEDNIFEVEAMDEKCEEFCDFFEIKVPKKKIDYYCANSRKECGDLIIHKPSNGYGSRKWNIIVSTSLYHPHELVHFLEPFTDENNKCIALSEGLAGCLGGFIGCKPEFTLIQTKNLITQPTYIPLKDLISLKPSDFKGKIGKIIYPEASAFVRFLLDKFGIQKFKELCSISNLQNELDKTFLYVYGFTIYELEEQWHEYLLNLDIPQVGFSIPPNAKLVFSMTDPIGDDYGDGNYTYPLDERFKKGMFDLRLFELLKDSTHAYFRIKLNKLVGPIVCDSTGEKFTSCVVIAINNGYKDSEELNTFLSGIMFREGNGYNLLVKITTGITIADDYDEDIFCTSNIVNCLYNITENKIEFSLPINYIGKPDINWKYFVGIGLHNDFGLDITNEGPVFVRKKAGEYTFGGANYAFVAPDFIDVLLPEWMDQKEKLRVNRKKRAIVPMVGNIDRRKQMMFHKITEEIKALL